MIEIECKARKWGNSIGIIIPNEIVTKENIHPNDTLKLKFEKEYDLTPIFGSLQRKVSGQVFKNLAREGWS